MGFMESNGCMVSGCQRQPRMQCPKRREHSRYCREHAALAPNCQWCGSSLVDVVAREESERFGMATLAQVKGNEIGAAMARVFSAATDAPSSDVLLIAKFFAQAGGYRDMDQGIEFVTGFMNGLDGAVRGEARRISSPTVDADGNPA